MSDVQNADSLRERWDCVIIVPKKQVLQVSTITMHRQAPRLRALHPVLPVVLQVLPKKDRFGR